jgi:hypothetical protein
MMLSRNGCEIPACDTGIGLSLGGLAAIPELAHYAWIRFA